MVCLLVLLTGSTCICCGFNRLCVVCRTGERGPDVALQSADLPASFAQFSVLTWSDKLGRSYVTDKSAIFVG